MDQDHDLIPPPPVIRERLARSLKETQMLRSLLRISVRMAEDHRSGTNGQTIVYADQPERARAS